MWGRQIYVKLAAPHRAIEIVALRKFTANLCATVRENNSSSRKETGAAKNEGASRRPQKRKHCRCGWGLAIDRTNAKPFAPNHDVLSLLALRAPSCSWITL